MKTYDLVVIGGGPAGLSAAIEGAEGDLSVCLIEENRDLGGKVLRAGNHGPSDGTIEKAEAKIGARLFHSFQKVAEKIDVYLNTEVWAVHDDKVLALHSLEDTSTRNRQIQAKVLVFSMGAMERVIPFPGWTLPGVFTVGGLNTLVKRGIVPGKAFVVAGSGPLLFVLVHHLIKADAQIRAVVDTAGWGDQFKLGFHAAAGANFDKLFQAVAFLSEIKRYRIPVYRSHLVGKANGDSNGVTAVTISKIDNNGHPITGSEKHIPADGLALGYGLIPLLDLTRLCGCEHYYDAQGGYWRVKKNETMETSIPGVFVAGDMASIKGYEAAMAEGQLAGMAACLKLGHLDKGDHRKKIQALTKMQNRAEKFGFALDAFSAPKPGIFDTITDRTIVCRCEEVTMGDIRTAVSTGAADVNDIKRRTRCGMGHCQGRFCGQVVNEVIWNLSDTRPDRGVFSTKMPVKPVSFEAFTAMQNGG